MTDTGAALIVGALGGSQPFGSNHPLGIPRVPLFMDMLRVLGRLDEADTVRASAAGVNELQWFHTPEYVAAIRACQERDGILEGYRRKYNIGNFENPYFAPYFDIPATAAGGSILGAEMVLAGRMAFNPVGGMHHAMPDKARGFCLFNDAVLGVMRLRRAGLRVLYVDMDAHHGDGVEYAFRHDDGVCTVSLHMDTQYAYPRKGGGISDAGPLANAVNLPLPKEVNDTEYRHAYSSLWPRIMETFRPEALVLQAGTDILEPDPLGKFRISNRLFWEAVDFLMGLSPRHSSGVPRLLILGGGGYHPIALCRCWAGVWSLLAGRDLPVEMPDNGREVLVSSGWDFEQDGDRAGEMLGQIRDEPREGEVRPDVVKRVEALLTTHPLFLGQADLMRNQLAKTGSEIR